MSARSSNSSETLGGMRRQPRQARSQERVNQILDVAEQLFIDQGYTATTTNAIAAGAKVSIGSLYQFFPDKAAILRALAIRYNERLYHVLVRPDLAEVTNIPLATYMTQLIDATDQFLAEHPGYYAIYMQAQGTLTELQEVESAADAQLIQELATLLSHYNPTLNPSDYEAIAFVLVKAIGNLLWLSLSQEPSFRQHLVDETKRLALGYLQHYFEL